MNINLRGLETAKKIKNKSAMAGFYNNMGLLERNIGLKKDAIEHFRLALTMFNPEEISKQSGTLGNIGLIYYDRKEADSAKYYFTKALGMVNESNDYYRISNMLGNLGAVEFDLEGNYSAATDYFNQALVAVELMEKTNTQGSGKLNKAYAFLYLGQIMVETKKYEEAALYFTEAEKLAASIPNNEILQFLYPKEAALAELSGKSEIAARYYKKYVQLMNEPKISQSVKNTLRLIFEEQKKNELQLHERDQQILQEKMKRKELRYILLLVIIFSILGATVTLLLLFSSRLKRQKLQSINQCMEQKRLMQELEFKKKELTANLLEMVRKNNLLNDISDKLFNNMNNQVKSDANHFRAMLNDLRLEESGKIWEEFKIRFTEVNNNFYSQLHEKFPDLTPNEHKLCALLYLNLSTKEIASITFQQYETVRTARYRLRKKLGLKVDESLGTFLRGIES
jgi:tetratricopeptide (TPR) repeat protein